MSKFLAIFCAALVGGFAVEMCAQEKQALRLVQTIPLPGVKGRLDHMGAKLSNPLGNSQFSIFNNPGMRKQR